MNAVSAIFAIFRGHSRVLQLAHRPANAMAATKQALSSALSVSIVVNPWFLSPPNTDPQNPQHFKGLQSISKQMSRHTSVRAHPALGVRPSPGAASHERVQALDGSDAILPVEVAALGGRAHPSPVALDGGGVRMRRVSSHTALRPPAPIRADPRQSAPIRGYSRLTNTARTAESAKFARPPNRRFDSICQ